MGEKKSLPVAQHRVTFNEAREVLCEEGDGVFRVTYSGLGERVRQEDRHKAPGLRVMLGQTSHLETVQLPLKLPESTGGRSVTFDEDSLLSYKRCNKFFVKCKGHC